MSQNPYANPYPQQYAQPGYPTVGMPPPARTSIMAVLSLVFSLLCCTAPLGVIFGGLALLAIAFSGGKVKGIGLAIAGLIIGIVVTVVVFGSAIAAVAGLNLVTGPAATTLTAIEQGDADGADNAFTTAAGGSITTQRVEEFRDLMADELGDFDAAPAGLGDWWSGYMAVFSNQSNGQAMQTSQNRYADEVIPVPMKFDTGWHLVLVVIDENSANQNNNAPLYQDIGFIRDDGSIEWLVAGNSGGGTGTGGFTPPDLDFDTPAGDEGTDSGAGTGADTGGGGDEPAPEEPATRRTRPNKP